MRSFARLASPIVSGVLVCLSGCRGTQTEGLESRAAALTVSRNAQIMGFEDPSLWTVSSGRKAATTQHTQGVRALALTSPVNYTTIVSAPLSSDGPELAGIAPDTAFLVDLLLPTQQPNPYWYGATQMFVNAPSRGVYNQYLGQIELTGKPLGIFKTYEFKFPAFVVQSLQGARFGDLTVTIVLNVPFAGTGVYLLDSLRVRAQPGSPLNVHPLLSCVVQMAPNRFEALFGYFNDSPIEAIVRVGANNRFVPGPDGRGELERFFPGRWEGAFAVVFDGAEIDWTMLGGAVAASSQSPRCATTTCAAPCARGEQCVGGSCVTEGGDGLCAGDEGCASAPADCACGGGQVCFDNGCAKPAQCGVDWQCGSGVSFGVTVVCGACPSGQTCVEHVCR